MQNFILSVLNKREYSEKGYDNVTFVVEPSKSGFGDIQYFRSVFFYSGEKEKRDSFPFQEKT